MPFDPYGTCLKFLGNSFTLKPFSKGNDINPTISLIFQNPGILPQNLLLLFGFAQCTCRSYN